MSRTVCVGWQNNIRSCRPIGLRFCCKNILRFWLADNIITFDNRSLLLPNRFMQKEQMNYSSLNCWSECKKRNRCLCVNWYRQIDSWKMAERAQNLYWLNKYKYCCRTEINIYKLYSVHCCDNNKWNTIVYSAKFKYKQQFQ